jgi:hypothetical protein
MVLNVDEGLIKILEELPPSRVGAPDLNVVGSSWALDIEGLIVNLGLDGHAYLIEVPSLSFVSISCLDNHISVVDDFEVSVFFQLWDNVEWSLDIKVEVFVEFSLSWFLWVFVSIDDIPLLVDSTMSGVHDNVSVFGVNTTWYIHNLVVMPVDEVWWGPSEHLPPSWVDAWCHSELVLSTVSWNLHDIVLPVVWSDDLGDWIKEPLLLLLVLSISLQEDIGSTLALSNSVHWESWDNVEWSVDVESEIFWKSLGLRSFSLVNVGDSPFLVSAIMSLVDNDDLSFSILSTWDIKCFSILPIDELAVLILEDLPPVGVSAVDLHVLGSSW